MANRRIEPWEGLERPIQGSCETRNYYGAILALREAKKEVKVMEELKSQELCAHKGCEHKRGKTEFCRWHQGYLLKRERYGMVPNRHTGRKKRLQKVGVQNFEPLPTIEEVKKEQCTIDFSSYPGLCDTILEISYKQVRSMQEQILYMVKTMIEGGYGKD